MHMLGKWIDFKLSMLIDNPDNRSNLQIVDSGMMLG